MSLINEFSREEYLLKGNAACAGCGPALALRYVLKALGPRTVLVIPASCSSIIAGAYPKSAFKVPVYHIAFAASAATASGLVEGLEAQGIEANVVVWAGDGGTVDIGLQGLSGAAERNHNITYICYDNEAYMNTGIQRSGATPYGAWTTTTPLGNKGRKKDLPFIMAAHNIPYVATASPAFPKDLVNKVAKAQKIRGFKYIHILAPCPTGWRYDPRLTVKIARLAVMTGFWPLLEIEHGRLRLNSPSMNLLDPARRRPLKEYLELQGRYRHLSEEDLKVLQRQIDEQWARIKAMLKVQEELEDQVEQGQGERQR